MTNSLVSVYWYLWWLLQMTVITLIKIRSWALQLLCSMLFGVIYGAVWSGSGWLRCWSITRTTGRKILTENIFMFYKSIGAVNTFCVILLTHEAQIVLTMAVKYLCDIGQQWWQADNDKWPDQCTQGTLTKNIFTKKYLISQQIVGITIQYWVYTKVCYYGAWCWAWPITIAAYLGPDPILMTVING